MAIINKISNTSSISYGGNTIASNTVITALLLPPTILKAVDKLTANIGDLLTYTITISNLSLNSINSLPFTDVIDPGATYVPSSFKVNGAGATPTIANNTLSYTIPTIASLGSVVIVFQVTIVGGSV